MRRSTGAAPELVALDPAKVPKRGEVDEHPDADHPPAQTPFGRGRTDRDTSPFVSEGSGGLIRGLPRTMAVGPAEQFAYLVRLLDAVDEGLTMCDRNGHVIHMNPSMEAILDRSPDPRLILAEVQVLSRVVTERIAGAEGDAGVLVRRMRAGPIAYSVRVAALGPCPAASDVAAIAIVRRRLPKPLSDGQLRKRYGLTDQEIRVARLLAVGKRNRQIADALFISTHTVRHHVSRVLQKLRIASRLEITAVLRNAVG